MASGMRRPSLLNVESRLRSTEFKRPFEGSAPKIDRINELGMRKRKYSVIPQSESRLLQDMSTFQKTIQDETVFKRISKYPDNDRTRTRSVFPRMGSMQMTGRFENENFQTLKGYPGMPNGANLLASSKDLIQKAIQEKYHQRDLEKHAKKTQAAELEAILELDTSRYNIQKTLLATKTKPGMERIRMRKTCGFDPKG